MAPGRALNALDRPLALVGFMGAGKSTLGASVASRIGRALVDVDELVAARAGRSIAEIFDGDGEAAFRELERATIRDVLDRREPAVVVLGGGAVEAAETRALLREAAFTVLLDVDVDTAWERVAGSDRPLAQDRAAFAALHRRRQPLYDEVADGRAADADGVVLAAAGVHVESGALARLGELVPGDAPVELVTDTNVARLYGEAAGRGLGDRLAATHHVPAGEAAKSPAELLRLWEALGLDRQGSVVALGGGTTLDLAGLAAATYLRGVSWVAVPTSFVAQVDAAIGGKTAIDLPAGKNLVGAFHWPAQVATDPGLLDTLPEAEIRNGLAEVVKTSLLAGEPYWELERAGQVRACAAFKAALSLRDPLDRGPRAQLNLGHTFAHALEAAADYELPHGQAVALGLLAALRLSGNEDGARVVEDVLRPRPVAVDRDRAWTALARDKKAAGGRPLLVLLEPGAQPRWGVAVDDAEVRSALDALIAR